jgi:hypothetical protein
MTVIQTPQNKKPLILYQFFFLIIKPTICTRWLHENVIHNRCQLGPNSNRVQPEHTSVLLSLITRLNVGVRVDIWNYTVRKIKGWCRILKQTVHFITRLHVRERIWLLQSDDECRPPCCARPNPERNSLYNKVWRIPSKTKKKCEASFANLENI